MLGKQSDFFSLIQFIPQNVGTFTGSELNEQIQGYTSELDTGNTCRFLSFFFLHMMMSIYDAYSEGIQCTILWDIYSTSTGIMAYH